LEPEYLIYQIGLVQRRFNNEIERNNMATHSHKITIDAAKEDVFKAITTIDGLQGWYTAMAEGDAGHERKIKLGFKSKEGPFHWKVLIPEPGSIVQWECLEGPGSSAGSTAVFKLADKGGGRTTVDLDHKVIDETDEKLKVCNTMWGALMLHLKKYVETKRTEPAFH
jgi:uncharacterized protein YndB with AHSA1/START domain